MKTATDNTADPVDRYVATQIRVRRRALGVSQEKLGDAIGVTFQQVQKYERATNRVSCSMLARIAATLQCSPAVFFEGAPEASTQDAEAAERQLWVLTEPGQRWTDLGRGLLPGAMESLLRFHTLTARPEAA